MNKLEGFPRVATIAASSVCVGRVTGADPFSFLQDTTTNDLSPEQTRTTCLLDGTGHVLAVFEVVPLGSEVLLVGPVASREALTGWLTRVAPLSGCEIIDESDDWSLTMIRGDGARDALPDAPASFSASPERFVLTVAGPLPGFDILTRGAVPVATMTEADWDGWRVQAGIPVFGIDITSSLIVNETPLLRTAVAEKGCYPGQETVAKIKNLGRVRRLVAGLAFAGDAPHDPSLTSRAGPFAIGVLRAEAVDAGTVEVAGQTASVHAL